ncbi:MAG: outer membrane lipid asymmetry maintenance protein MlaD [Gammaproteobacteria bacterium]|nr:outer membrane lipid asymmetry maintenance protein MlaD [Gammaproteobacteria bacterium]NNL06486.1 outer membrane lipid asymmetry maintenance protein MlaD [Gammaproteobacteria bacterium]
MNTRTLEITVGLFVAAGLGALFMLAMKVSNLATYGGDEGYVISASFDNIGGLKVRSPVAASGVRVGQVIGIEYDSEGYEARVTMSIDPQYDKFPTDTAASVLTSGLLGEQFIGLQPGAEEEFLTAGSEIELTQSALVLEQIVGQFLYSMTED